MGRFIVTAFSLLSLEFQANVGWSIDCRFVTRIADSIRTIPCYIQLGLFRDSLVSIPIVRMIRSFVHNHYALATCSIAL